VVFLMTSYEVIDFHDFVRSGRFSWLCTKKHKRAALCYFQKFLEIFKKNHKGDPYVLDHFVFLGSRVTGGFSCMMRSVAKRTVSGMITFWRFAQVIILFIHNFRKLRAHKNIRVPHVFSRLRCEICSENWPLLRRGMDNFHPLFTHDSDP
jgi:hypothetical protein